MKSSMISVALAFSALSAPAPAAAVQAKPADPVAEHLAKAKAVAGSEYLPVQEHLCYLNSSEDQKRLAARRAAAPLKPTRVFDNFYYVGAQDVAAWALVDPKGIILFDSLHNPKEAEAKVVQGLQSLGLDPHAIKYVVITHGHGDHFGGAQYLADTFGAQLVTSDIDWAAMHDPTNRAAQYYAPLIPKQGLSRNDGQTLELGGLKISFYVTPGHTPGVLSSLFQVRDHGRPRTVAFWGGVGLRDKLKEDQDYIASLDRFRALAKAAGAEIAITNHPHADMTLERVAGLGPYPRSSNPMIVGFKGVDQWFDVVEECAKAQVAKLSAASTANTTPPTP